MTGHFDRLRLLTIALAWGIATANTFAADHGEQAGKQWTGERGKRETMADIMARQEQQDAKDKGKPKEFKLKKERENPERDRLPQNPNSPKVARWVPSQSVADNSVSSLAPLSPQTFGVSFTGATLADTGSFPPDTMGAVGPSQFVVFVNGRIRTFDKATGVADSVMNANPDVFFGSVMTPVGGGVVLNFTSDPQVRFDRLSGRWFLTIIDVPCANGTCSSTAPNRALIAVSDSSTISGSTVWTFYFFQGDSTNFLDYPSLGIDVNALYIGGNMFNSAGTSFLGCNAYVVQKASVLSGGPIVVTKFTVVTSGSAAGPYSPRGVDNFDPAATVGYFIGVDNATFGKLQLCRVSNPGGSPTISTNIAITVSTTTSPITVPHLGNTGGTSGNLDALDDRLFAAHLRNGRLWTAHNIQVNSSGVASSTGGRDGARWYELQNVSATPSVAQSGTIFDPAASNPLSYWIPSVMVSGQGHVAAGFSSAGAAAHANAATVGRLLTDTLGTMQTVSNYTASTTAYNPPSDPGGTGGRRWGDYSFTCVDPNDDMTMWTIQEFCDSANSYGVRAIKLFAPPPATPVSVNPALVIQGATSVNVNVSGTQTNGSGFFDPGAGFSNRISAAVNGGSVTVNSVTYANPTNITLNVTVAAASPTGTYPVTVTNPDGQSVTSASGILTIIPSGPLLVADGATVTAESCLATNGVIDPGETITVNLGLKNVGVIDASNVVATLQATGGVTSPSGAQPYGLLGTNGITVIEPFTFTATGNCGGSLTASLQLQDGTNNLGNVLYTFPLGQTVTALTQNFDAVTAPSLPAGWSASAAGGQSNWVTSTAAADTASNAAFCADIAAIGVNELDAPSVSITSTSAVLSFRQNYSLEVNSTNSTDGFDGGVLDIKIGAGSYADILAAGGTFISGGYNATLTSAYANPLAGRQAWSGNSGGFTTTVVNLPASAAGQNIQLRWRCAAGTNPPPASSSGTLAYWNFNGSSPAPTTVAASITASSVTISNVGGSLTYFSGNPNTGQAIATSGFSTSAGSPTTATSCFAFSTTVSNGSQATVTGLSFDDQRSMQGPANFTVQASQQANFSSTIYDSGVRTSHTAIASGSNTFTLANSNLTGTVYFRIYGYNAVNAGGTWRLDNLNLQGSTIGGGTVGTGWFVDTVSISDPVCCVAATNSAPVINAANVSPASPTTTNELLAVVTSATDVNSDPITFAYQWQESSTNLTGQTASNLLASVTFAGGSYRVIITPNDGLTNGAPFTTASVLVPVDADGNGINDDWEVTYFGHIGIDPNTDSDGDGLSDLQEYLASTNPTNAASTLAITSIMSTGDDVLVSWLAAFGRTYVVQTNSPSGGDYTNNFTDLSPSIVITGIPGTGEMLTNYPDIGGATNGPTHYYRVRLLP